MPAKSSPADLRYMREALSLAQHGVGKTKPNPAVGCVIVKNHRILARGWHRQAGQPHAEIEALRSLKNLSLARGATVYVTLEPCSTHGRTPPCTNALVAAGITRLVIGAIDPNPRHRGRGLRLLQKAGIDVTEGVLAGECEALNPEFHHAMSTGLPWVIAKCGMSLDGRLTRPRGESPWITSPESRDHAMQLRTRVDAILVGAATVRADNPSLTIRGSKLPAAAEQPWRVIWAPRRLPPRSKKVFTDSHRERTLVLRQKSLRAALRELNRRGIQSVLIEGGGHTLGRAFAEHLVNEVFVYIAPVITGGRTMVLGDTFLQGSLPLLHPRYEQIGPDILVHGVLPDQVNPVR